MHTRALPSDTTDMPAFQCERLMLTASHIQKEKVQVFVRDEQSDFVKCSKLEAKYHQRFEVTQN